MLRFETVTIVGIIALLMVVTLVTPIVYTVLSGNVTIPSSGQIGLTSIVANSGSASDIQAAVNYAAANGISNVTIPQGAYDFVAVGQTWVHVSIPTGIDIYGASTQRDSNGHVIEWGTVLRMPFEAPENSRFFTVYGTTGTRISDIKFVGYRELNANSDAHYTAIFVQYSSNFRVDHCSFLNVAGQCVQIQESNGVVDHCDFVNNKNVYVTNIYNDCTVWYGVAVNGDNDLWVSDISDVLGASTSCTVFIEDNYFEGWRHSVASNRGAHYVFRYNVERKNGYGSIDAHGREGDGSSLGTRAIEVYGNNFGDPVWGDMGVQLRGGGGVFFDNNVDGYGLTGTAISQYSAFVCMVQYTPDDYPDQQIKDVWIWDNTLTPSGADLWDAAWGGIAHNGIEEGSEFYLRAPSQSLDGFTYTAYPYPHPLVTY